MYVHVDRLSDEDPCQLLNSLYLGPFWILLHLLAGDAHNNVAVYAYSIAVVPV